MDAEKLRKTLAVLEQIRDDGQSLHDESRLRHDPALTHTEEINTAIDVIRSLLGDNTHPNLQEQPMNNWELKSKQYLVIEFTPDQMLAVPIATAADDLTPIFKIVETSTNTQTDGFRSIFELAKDAPAIELTAEHRATLLRALYDYITESGE